MAHFDLQCSTKKSYVNHKVPFNASKVLKVLSIITVVLLPWHTHSPTGTFSVKWLQSSFFVIELFQDFQQEDDPLKKLSQSSQKIVQCRHCKGDHWTTKCPYKDQLEVIHSQVNEAKLAAGKIFPTSRLNYYQMHKLGCFLPEGQ